MLKISDIETALSAGKRVDLQPDGAVTISDASEPEPCELCDGTEYDPGCGLCVKRKRAGTTLGGLRRKLSVLNEEIKSLDAKRDAIRKEIRDCQEAD